MYSTFAKSGRHWTRHLVGEASHRWLVEPAMIDIPLQLMYKIAGSVCHQIPLTKDDLGPNKFVLCRTRYGMYSPLMMPGGA